MTLLRAILAGLLLFLWAGTQPVQALSVNVFDAEAPEGGSGAGWRHAPEHCERRPTARG